MLHVCACDVAALPNNPGNPAMFDWGTYVNGGRPDPTWRVRRRATLPLR